MTFWQKILTLFTDILTSIFGSKQTIERPSPRIRIQREQITLKDGTLTVTGLGNCFLAALEPSNSMDPSMDTGMIVVLDAYIPFSDIVVGDIIYYKSPNFEAIHRVIEIGEDDGDWCAMCKGDNNGYADPGVVRVADVKGVWRGTLN